MLPFLKYTVMRLALFVASMGLLYVLGVRGVLNIGLAAVISLMLSYLLLRGPREELSQEIADRVSHRLKDPSAQHHMLGMDDDADVEDAAIDAAEHAEPETVTPPAESRREPTRGPDTPAAGA